MAKLVHEDDATFQKRAAGVEIVDVHRKEAQRLGVDPALQAEVLAPRIPESRLVYLPPSAVRKPVGLDRFDSPVDLVFARVQVPDELGQIQLFARGFSESDRLQHRPKLVPGHARQHDIEKGTRESSLISNPAAGLPG